VTGARFLIVGRNPGRAVRKLAAVEGVEVTGYVPDVRPHLARMCVSVAPFSIAAGIQNKMLEAMACGIPVVATSRATQGLSPNAAGVVDIADDPYEMADRIVRLMSDSRLARRRGLEGRRQVAAEYTWEQALEQFMQLVEGRAASLHAVR